MSVSEVEGERTVYIQHKLHKKPNIGKKRTQWLGHKGLIHRNQQESLIERTFGLTKMAARPYNDRSGFHT
ncbi:hypothetical protein J6590_063706 [Homalodisca vitripennis]|nr:hypothetical protein J6590_063706 [Homalodisca vitripennis]